MERRSCVVPCMTIAWLLSASQIESSDAVSVSVSPAVAWAPAQITVRVSVEPHAENRAIEVVTESETYYRKSYLQVDGDRAARTSILRYRDLPSGDYNVRVLLFDAEGIREGPTIAKIKIRP